ncbi:tRNA wybutosine-synthesizing protein 3 homolog isoform X2 [Phyllostomus discolor]|uniref:tRNA wybutosine-synthesizing protein 3 homolog n=1 Tax=Phyllostomus discolor TaxID=89673 RepID=A0A7E6DSL7_9CHIR|nr:tRNA wybutosine-synthesizing protein 3 homolog isoform X2 [Phyllostomus discolor]
MDRSAEFRRWKAQCLSKADLSLKGSVDEDVAEIVQLLNGQEQFFTTSSCSGRIILIDGSINGFEVQKQNCRWLLVTHKPCTKDDVIVALRNANGDAVLKFEPLVLHVQCRQLQDAQILAVRSTHGLEVPLSHEGKLMVTEDYIDFLLKIANQKMEENRKRIERFYSCLQHALERQSIIRSYPKEKVNKKINAYSPKKKRNQEKARDRCIAEENDKELENNDSPGISAAVFPEDDEDLVLTCLW